jgi:hypothetical protein
MRSQSMNTSHAPVTNASPVSTSSPPPTRVTQRLLRRTARKRPSRRWKPSPNAMNGSPRPRQYARPSTAARGTEDSTAARPNTTPMVGPVHGIQDSANTAPNTGAPSSPADGSRWMRHSRCSTGTKPANTSPNRMMSEPTTISIVRRCV